MAIACVLTVLIENSFFWLLGYRSLREQIIVAVVNIITNITLNLVLVPFYDFIDWGMWVVVFFLEVIVVLVEFALYAYFWKPSVRLFLLTFFANCLSFGVGLLLNEVYIWL